MTAGEPAIDGARQPDGCTEPILRGARRAKKQERPRIQLVRKP